ncbi:MAG: NUDIX hydrolase N-terminal domain-containing protein [bacterium]|nr:NUDIX hydrolase N-terminal domain-containing protein [bacterium]
MKPNWLEWARALQAIAQTGIYFSEQRPDSTGTDGPPYHQIMRITAEMISAGSEERIEHISGLLKKMSGIATPQATVSGAIFRDDALLLVKRRGKDAWMLPGETAEFRDTFSQTVTRAMEEETGYRTEVEKLVAVYDQQQPPFIHRYHLIFKCEISEGPAPTNDQVEEVAFFKEKEIPPVTPGGLTAAQISRLYEHDRNSTLPTDFD